MKDERLLLNELADALRAVIENEPPIDENDEEETTHLYDCIHALRDAMEDIGMY